MYVCIYKKNEFLKSVLEQETFLNWIGAFFKYKTTQSTK